MRYPANQYLPAFLAAALLCATPALPAAAQTTATPTLAPEGSTPVSLTAPDGRTVQLFVWQAEAERGVVVFSHGLNGSPAAYHRIIDAWRAHGFTVVAPLHVDSLQHPNHADYDNRAAFMTRIADLAMARGWAQETHPGMPQIAAGHSFGSLMSLISGGAVTAAGPQADPALRGVIAFSSAGDLPGLITPETYAGLTTPLLMITGDQDTVPGYVADWRAHRSPFDRSPAGDKTLIIVAGGDHRLVGDADEATFAFLVDATEAFLDGYGADDAEARARLAALTAPDGVTIERR